MSNPKPDLQNINRQIKSGENPLRFTQVIVLKLHTDVFQADNCQNLTNLPISGQTTQSKVDKICH